ncbi:hypothetical protein [Okeania sp. SIO2B3]|uniref:hypothetical protein n=1 Tax=Okeania sp. SIO2B3 TaxID=2607784 RepID=UPI0013C233E0|nr:hypothetical protein [Okeania sp. SIO2B3]NET46963.1 hypothetical protein [Okeania sp. SIO2B3]
MLDLKLGCWASSVSLWSDRKTKKRLDLGGWCIEAERPNQRWLGIPRCLVEQRREDVNLVTNNRSSMPVHLAELLAESGHVPGILVLRPSANIGRVIEDLIAIAGASFEDEYRDQITYIPLI